MDFKAMLWIFVAFIFLSASFVLDAVLAYVLSKTIQAKSWIKVPGEITGIYRHIEDTDDGPVENSDIWYRYNVDGSYFKSNRVAFGLTNTPNHWAGDGEFMEVTSSFPKVQVYVNPKNPGEATLLVGFRLHHLQALIFCILFSLIAICAACVEVKKYLPACQAIMSAWFG